MPARHLLTVGVLLLAAANSAGAQVIIGHVTDETSKLAIRAVDIQLVDGAGLTRGRTLSDSTGLFRLQAPIPGTYRVTASALGYANLTTTELLLDQGTEVELEIRLVARGIPLEPLRVIERRTFALGRLADYYRRAEWTRKSGLGRVFMRDDMERLDPFSVSSVLRMQPRRAGCPMVTMLDGLPITDDLVDQLIKPEEVEGIEIYRSLLELPPEYQRRTPCALTLIWTRRDLPHQRKMTWRRILISVGFVALLFGAQRWVRN